jgi:tetratricopeptide (TPR) repeat protein
VEGEQVKAMSDSDIPETPEAFSLFGEPLFRAPLRPETLEKQEALYAEAFKGYRENPDDPDAIVWFGRRTAYLGRYRESVAIYSKGLERYPEEPKLYRHRGHRYISLRRFNLAVDDFEKAAALIEGKPDEVEPDGIPNERNTPVSSLHFNIWYHLGLAYYVSGRFEDALRAYRSCMEVSKIPDKIVATSHWLYMTLRLLGKEREAAEVLEPIEKGMDVIENQNYHDCLLMYKGQTNVEALMEKAREQGTLGLVTIGYGVANWYNYNGERGKAKAILEEILDTGSWAGFGYIAAEADLKRLG